MRAQAEKAADDTLAAAIEDALVVHGLKTGVTTEFVVLVAQQHVDDDGDTATNIARLISDNSIPYYRILGLLDFAATCYRAEITDMEDL